MKKKTTLTIICIIVIFIIGFILWQEYTKYKMRKTIQEAFWWIEDIFTTDNEETNTSKNTIKDKEKDDSKKEVIDTSINLKKWIEETIKGNYEWKDLEVNFSLTDVSFIDEIEPPEPRTSYYTYYPKQDGKTFAVAYITLKNLWGSSFDINYVIKNLYDSSCSSKAIFWWKYEYTADLVAEISKDSKWQFDFESSFVYLDPLETKNIIVAYSVPDEVKDMDAELNICLWNQKIKLDFTNPTVEESPNDEEVIE